MSSKGWQFESALDLIGSAGRIVVEYFDVGCSRRLAWSDRPQARRLLDALSGVDRPFDSIVIGEAERAFCAGQLPAMAGMFAEQGVQIWLPELNGPLETTNPAHHAVILELGARSRREVLRARFRTTAAMRAQTRDQGRYLGGHPPYGYRLVDAGPHPNRVHARWGRRLQRLDPDPYTAAIVTRIFQERLAGRTVSSIARELNEADVPCPSAADAPRNPHRPGHAWTDNAIATILANPRYTGHQVWNRQPSRHVPVVSSDHNGLAYESGRRRVQNWGDPGDWVVSKRVAHPALITSETFFTVQGLHSEGSGGTTSRRRDYRLAGPIRCVSCGRKMDSHWINNRPGYRCRHGQRSSRTRQADQPGNLNLREDELFDRLRDHQLGAGRSATLSDLVDYLRKDRMTITCDHRTLVISEGTRPKAESTGA